MARKRPSKAQRNSNQNALVIATKFQEGTRREGKQEMGSKKRKKDLQEGEDVSTNKAQCLKVVPKGGLPNPQ